MDNINKWKHDPYHIYARLKDEQNKNITESETETLQVMDDSSDEDEFETLQDEDEPKKNEQKNN